MTLPRTHAKRLTDREASKQTLLGRVKRIGHCLAGIPTGKDAWTVDDHRASIVAPPAIIPAIHIERLRRETHGVEGPPTLAEHQAEVVADQSVAPAVKIDRRLGPGPKTTPQRRQEIGARLAAPKGIRALPKLPDAAALARWNDWKATAAPVPRTSIMDDVLPPSFGVDPGDRITHQRIADQAAKAIAALESCGHWRGVYQCPSHGAWAATSSCGHRLCTPCQVRRRAELLDRYGPHLTTITDKATGSPRVPMLTATQEGIPGEWLGQSFDRLLERHRAFARSVQKELTGTDCRGKLARKQAKKDRRNIGGLTSLEATPRPDRSWNAHAHILLREPAHVPDAWTVPGWRKRPLDPWRFRLLWATALIDGRSSDGAAEIAQLTAAYTAGRQAWIRKMRANKPLTTARAREAEKAQLKAWALACKAAGVPSVVDLRWVHPAEGLKYVTKGYDLDPKRGEPLTDWHLWQLLIGTYYLRRSIPWGSLYRLPKADEAEKDDETDDRPCPHCGAASIPIPRDQWKGSGAVTDALLIAFRLDRREFQPRGSPDRKLAPVSRPAPLPALGFSRAELDLMIALGEIRAPSPQAPQGGELLEAGSLA